jgi:hypothetical protein
MLGDVWEFHHYMQTVMLISLPVRKVLNVQTNLISVLGRAHVHATHLCRLPIKMQLRKLATLDILSICIAAAFTDAFKLASALPPLMALLPGVTAGSGL